MQRTITGSPLCWRLIETAVEVVGWQMSVTKIIKMAKAWNPEVFEKLLCETVQDWINWSSEKPWW
jgi:hypothetical protein